MDQMYFYQRRPQHVIVGSLIEDVKSKRIYDDLGVVIEDDVWTGSSTMLTLKLYYL
jgi:hypothetical protein